MWIIVAAAVKPNNVDIFFKAIREAWPEVTAGVIAEGYGCNNFEIIIEANDERAEQVANQITMALMPARWSTCEGDPMLKPGEFYDAR